MYVQQPQATIIKIFYVYISTWKATSDIILKYSLNMDWIKYLKESERTLSTEFHCGHKVEKLLHGTIGILTEIEEILENYVDDKFDNVNVLEEVGDIFWYLSILSREFNIDISDISETNEKNPKKIMISIIIDSLKMLDILKKKLYYNKEIKDDMIVILTKSILSKLVSYSNIYNIEIPEIFNKNINKLRIRYPEKFDPDLAINRNLEGERKILEK